MTSKNPPPVLERVVDGTGFERILPLMKLLVRLLQGVEPGLQAHEMACIAASLYGQLLRELVSGDDEGQHACALSIAKEAAEFFAMLGAAATGPALRRALDEHAQLSALQTMPPPKTTH